MNRIEQLITELNAPATCEQASYAATHLLACADQTPVVRARLQAALDQMPPPEDDAETRPRFW